jgi:beta-ureidopropionase / N-carbamoyl-L-amino-acid hydrolase
LAQLDTAFPDVPRIPLGFACAAYLETHLEQGPLLDDGGCQIGIVTGMQGVRRFRVTVQGEAAHAGAMPRNRRRDALSATMRIIAALENFYAAPDVAFTVGQLSVEPNAPSIVPRQTTFSIDIRHRSDVVLARLGDAIKLICESETRPCSASVSEISASPSILFDGGVRQLTLGSAQRLGLSTMELVSMGGHDAMTVAGHCPSGIIFIPCQGGVSHSEAEAITAASALNGTRVLTDALWDLSNR